MAMIMRLYIKGKDIPLILRTISLLNNNLIGDVKCRANNLLF
jgi:hypothetical protein